MEKHYYNLSYVLYSPAESTEPDKYMAEAPDLPGCRAWGDTPEEAIEILASLAPAFDDGFLHKYVVMFPEFRERENFSQ